MRKSKFTFKVKCFCRMGGCRCVYRSCQSSTNITPGLHYFHFPIRDPDRCEQWIKNARKPTFRSIPREKLRNKVVCSLHFEEHCFTNEKKDRLIHNAIPTLGCEDEQEEMCSDKVHVKEENVILIPTNEDNTKFILPDVDFPGMSYTIYDDAVIPSSTVPALISQNDKSKFFAVLKKSGIEAEEPKPKRPKITVTSVKVSPAVNTSVSTNSHKTFPSFIKDNQSKPFETTSKNNGSNITSYSLSTCGDDVTVELSQSKEFSDQNCSLMESAQDAPLLDNEISLKLKGENEYSIAVLTETPINKQEIVSNSAEAEIVVVPPQETSEIQSKSDFVVTPEREYIRMIKNNSKQIFELKKLVNKQNRIQKYLQQRRQLSKFKRKRWSKYKLLELLKHYVKPSLMAILKLEILPQNDVVLTDNEEKFISDLYTEDIECYNTLRRKYCWNLPYSESFEEKKN